MSKKVTAADKKSDRIIVAEASAGSGKTRLLTIQFLSLLLSERRPSPGKILAITFTNEAAFEMKSRIIEWLKKAALGDAETIKNIIGRDNRRISPRLASSRALAGIAGILENYLDLNVHTIDSFVNSVAVSSAVEIGLPPRYEIVTDETSHLNAVASGLLESAGTSSAGDVFDDFLDAFLNIEASKAWNPRDAFLDALEFLYSEENSRGRRFVVSGLRSGLASARKNILKTLREEAAAVGDKRSRGSMLKKLKDGHIEELSGPQIKLLSEGLRERLEVYYTALSRARFDSYVETHNLFRRAAERYKSVRRLVFISDLNSKIASYVSSGSPPSVYFMLGDRIEHFLIDEFQDTSEIQWKNLAPLVENSVSSGGSFFYVGDKKQALYRWRGGRVELFDEAASSVGPADIGKIVLDENYRSRQGIVDFVNEHFRAERLANLGLPRESLAAYENARQEVGPPKNKTGGRVSVEKISVSNTDELEAALSDRITALVGELAGDGGEYRPGEIGVLVRKNEDVKKVTGWLLGAGWPVVSEITMSLRENRLVRQIMSALRFLDFPSDDLAFASFVTGEIFAGASGLELREILGFFEENRDSGRSVRRGKAAEVPVSVLFRERFPDVWKSRVRPLEEAAAYMPPYDILREIYDEYAVEERFCGSEIFFARLLEIAKDFESSEGGSPGDFIEYWKHGPARDFEVVLPGDVDAVKVSTIHKAKGLSYPVVIMAFAPAGRNIDRSVEESPEGLRLRCVSANYAKFSSEAAQLRDAARRRELLDEVNVAYVGATRAARDLAVILYETARRKNPFMAVFGESPPLPPRRGAARGRTANVSVLGTTAAVASGREYLVRAEGRTQKWRERFIAMRAGFDDGAIFDYARRAAVLRGDIAHGALAMLDGPPVSPETVRKAVETSARRLGVAAAALRGDIAGKILALLDNPEFAAWFSAPGENEKELADENGRLMRVDRIAVAGPGRKVIIEYKTGESYHERHAAQIIKYRNCASRLWPGTEFSCRLVYIDEGRIVSP